MPRGSRAGRRRERGLSRGALPRLWSDRFWRAVNPETGSAGFHRADPGWLSPVRHVVMPDFDLWYVAGGCGEVRGDGVHSQHYFCRLFRQRTGLSPTEFARRHARR